MKPKSYKTRGNLFATAFGCASIVVTISSSPAAAIYWDGPTGGWDAVANWSTVSTGTTPDPAAVPVAADDAIFNIDGANAATVVNLNANQAVQSLSFKNTGTTLLQGGGTNRTLAIGAGGITVDAAAGAATIGTTAAGQSATVTLSASQTWANNSPNVLTFGNTFTSAAGIGLVKAGTGNVLMSNTGNATAIGGLLDIQAGKIQVAGDFTMNGGLTGTNAGSIENGGSASKWVFVSSATDGSYGGTIQGNPANPTGARLGFVKRGPATFTLTGLKDVADALRVEAGVLSLNGTVNTGYAGIANNAGNAGQVYVGTGTANSVLNVNGGTLNASRAINSSIIIAGAANARGFFNLSAGTVTSSLAINVGNGNGAVGTHPYAAMSVSGGTLNVGSWLVVGANNDRAILNQSGGTILETTNRMTIGAGGNGSIGVANLSGGSLTVAAGGNTGVFLGENGTGILNLSGSGALNLQTNGGATSGTFVFGNNATSLAATLNLNGGTLTTKEFVKGASTAGAVNRISFNGGTIRPNANNTSFLGALANTIGYVNPGGVVVDTNNFNVTAAMPLLAPNGSGVSAIAVATGGAGYLDTPLVTLSGGTGTGAQAIATVSPYVMTNGVVTSGGAVTGFVITNPGVGYLPGDVLTATLFGGGATTAATVGAITLAPNVSGGLSKTGAGTLTLSGASTFTGATTITGGSLQIDSLGDINTSSGITINGAGAKLVQTGGFPVSIPIIVTDGAVDGTTTLSSVTVGNSATNIVTHGNGGSGPLQIDSLAFTDAAAINLNIDSFAPGITTGTLNSGAAGGGKITVNATSPTWAPGVYDLITYTTLTGGGAGEFQQGTISGLSGRQSATMGSAAGKITLSVTGDKPVWSGGLNGNWTTAPIGAPKNWKLVTSGAATDYINGDIVLFDDSAVGTTSINISTANVSPLSTTFFNDSLEYDVSSTGGFGIATGSVTLNGLGNVALASPNIYPGGTIVNGGTLRINHASAIGTGALTLAGPAVSIDNTSGVPITLGTNNAQNWNTDLNFLGSDNLSFGTGIAALNANRLVNIQGSATLDLAGISGAGFGITKTGTGILGLSGASTYTGATTVSNGTLLLTGAINSANTANVGQVVVGTATESALLHLAGGTLNATSTAAQGLSAGTSSGGTGAFLVDSGTINVTSEVRLGTVNGGNGALVVNGGTVNVGNWFSVGRDGNGVLRMTGGNLTVSTQHMTLGSFATGYGETTIGGGTASVTNTTAGQGNFYVGEGGTGVLTVSGSAALNVAGTLGVRMALNGATSSGTVNLNGGVTTTPAVTKGAGTGILNFNGGTLRATTANAAYMGGLTGAFIYGGGAAINNNGANIVIDQPLLAPTGNGVTSAGLTVTGTGYISPPQVRISGGGGSGATALAIIDAGGNLTGITITNPGINYTSDPLFELVGGGGSGSVTGSPALVANTSGSLILSGAGTLGLTGASTYTGATSLGAGTLALTGAGSVNSSSGISVNGSGAKLLQTSSVAVTAPVAITSGSLDGVGSLANVTVANAAGNIVANGNGGAGALAVNSLAFADAATVNVRVSTNAPGITAGTLNSGAAGGGKITVNASNISWANGQVYNLISYSSLSGGGFGEFQQGTVSGLTTRQSATLTNPSGNVALSITGDSPVWTGAFDGSWTTAAITAPKNWKLVTGGTPTDFLSLDSVLFDDTATGTSDVVITENLVLTGAVFGNAAKNYTLASPGGFGITTGFVTLSGTGQVSIGNANTYAGATTVNSGTLNINNASAIGTGPLILNGGTLDSTAAADVVLTTNNSVTWNADFSFTGTKNLSLGTGAVTLGGSGTTRTVTTTGGKLTVGALPVATGFGLTKSGAGTLAINGTVASTLGGDLNVVAGTFEIGAQNFTATGLTGFGTVTNGAATGSTLIVNNTAAKSFAGSLQNGAGAGLLGLTKQGTGTLSLSGSSSLTNEVRVEGGVLNIAGGTLNATKTSNPSLSIGSAANARAALTMSSGAINSTAQINIGNGNGAAGTNPYAAMSISGGTVTSGSWLVVGANNDRGILNQSGGNINVVTNRMTIAAGGNGAIGVANLSGGIFTNGAGIFLGENGTGTLNISGSSTATMGNMQFGGNATSIAGYLNLLGGALNTGSITKGASTAGAVYTVNFNGGTLRATAANASFFAALANTTAYVNSGGAVIDDGGFAITVAQPLLAPSGSGLGSIAVTSGGAGYIDTPFVTIAGGTGTGASAVANVSGGVVTGFTVTNPGNGYSPGDVLTVTLFGGGATTPATVGAVNLTTNVGGGLTKSGSGVLTLSGLNTYAGNTVVSNGTLSIVNDDTLADGADVRLSATGTLNLTFVGTDTVDEFLINNVAQATGEWGAVGSGAAHTSPQITGTGRLLVSTGGSDPYQTWADGFPGLTDKTPGADFDKDGLSNLLEFILGGNPTVSSQSIAPVQTLNPTSLVFTFKRSDESEAPATVQTIETSTNLSNWASSVIAPITIGAGNSSGTGYTVNVAENGAAADDVTVTIARGANTIMFARLRANKP
ncbi:MAG: autotransporter-associated beta strand repeat-containing protein [Verrucomicrobiota bacterium]